MKTSLIAVISFFLINTGCSTEALVNKNRSAVVLTTDFSLKDGAVSAMKGVAFAVDPQLTVSDLTHEIEPYNIWEAAYRLQQTYKYWPTGTVFVTVVDPGVGSSRRSIVMRTKSGHYFVGPDNGHLTLIATEAGIENVRAIDEAKQRLKGSEESYTFHGRDLYVYVGARLAAGKVKFEDLGPSLDKDIVRLQFQSAEVQNGKIRGTITVLDPNYGNVWTNIPKKLLKEVFNNKELLRVQILHSGKRIFEQTIPLAETFAKVNRGQPLAYFNSLLNVALALNMDNFAKKFAIGSGPDWTITIEAK